MKKYFLFFLLVSFSVAAMSQSFLSVHGHIVDEQGEPIMYANVALYGTKYAATSDAKGHFSFRVPEGQYTMQIAVVGCIKLSESVQIKPEGKAYLGKFVLQTAQQALKEVVVTGTRTAKRLSEVPILTKVVGSEEIMQSGCVNVLDALESAMPGIQFSPDAHGNNMTIQGLDSKYILVLVDGQRMVGETRGNVNFDRIAAADIQQIEVVNGASSVLYGSNAIGGVINIITKKTTQPIEGKIDTRYSDFNTLNTNFSVGTKQDKFSLSLNGFRNSSDGYDLTPETPESFTAYPFVDYSASVRGQYQPNRQWDLSAHATIFRHENANPQASLKSTHGLNKNHSFGAKAAYAFNANHKLSLSSSHDLFDAFRVYEKRNNEKDKSSDYKYHSFLLSDTYSGMDNVELITGVEMNLESVFSYIVFGEHLTGKEKHKQSQDFNLFAQADWKAIEDLELIGGVRYTHHKTFGSHFTPNFSAMYTPVKGLKLRGTAALGYKSPSLKELYYNFDHQGMFWIYGNEELKPENSHYFSLSGEYTLGLFNVSVSAYHNMIDDKIDMLMVNNTITGKMEFHHYNINQAEIQGVETFVNWKFLSNFKTKLGYAFADAVDKSTGLQISGNSKHTATALLTYYTHHQKFPMSLSLSGRFLSPRLYQSRIKDANGNEVFSIEETEAYSLWKLTYIQEFPKWKSVQVSLKCGINNIFDYSNLEKSAAVNPGRTFWVGFALQF